MHACESPFALEMKFYKISRFFIKNHGVYSARLRCGVGIIAGLILFLQTCGEHGSGDKYVVDESESSFAV
jgi:hypothetical protein